MGILKEIKKWRSIRRYKAKKIAAKKIKNVLEAGRRAPSWQNLQPWHFMVIEQEEDKKHLSKIAATKKVVEKASAVIIVLGDVNGFEVSRSVKMIREQVGGKMSDEDLKKYLSQKISCVELGGNAVIMARLLEQAAYACAFMILEASHQGLGACVVGGLDNPLSDQSVLYKEVKQYFKIPQQYEVLTLLTLGYPNEKISQRSRKNLEEIVSHSRFGA